MSEEKRFDIGSIGLQEGDLNGYVNSSKELVDAVSCSGRLYYKSVKYVLLCKIQRYLNDSTIEETDEMKVYFPRRNRKATWNQFRDQFGLKVPELKLSKIATSLLVIVLTIGLIGFFASTDELIHLELSGLNVSVIVSGLIVLPIGIILNYGRTELPVKNFDELTDEIMKINMTDLLSEDKKRLKELLMLNLHPTTRASCGRDGPT